MWMEEWSRVGEIVFCGYDSGTPGMAMSWSLRTLGRLSKSGKWKSFATRDRVSMFVQKKSTLTRVPRSREIASLGRVRKVIGGGS